MSSIATDLAVYITEIFKWWWWWQFFGLCWYLQFKRLFCVDSCEVQCSNTDKSYRTLKSETACGQCDNCRGSSGHRRVSRW